MKAIIYTSFLLLYVGTACQNSPRENFTVIDNLKLGVNEQAFYRSCDSLGMKKKHYVGEAMMTSSANCLSNSLYAYSTTQFSGGSYTGSSPSHTGIIYPQTFRSISIIDCLTVLLGYEAKTYFLDTPPNSNQNPPVSTFTQDVNIEMLKEIRAQLIQKYGPPKDTLRGPNIPVFIIQGNKIESHRQGSDFDGVLYRWEAPLFEVLMFDGLRSNRSTFDIKDGGYSVSIYGQHEIKKQSEIDCRSYPFIEYIIKEEVLTRLKLNVPKL